MEEEALLSLTINNSESTTDEELQNLRRGGGPKKDQTVSKSDKPSVSEDKKDESVSCYSKNGPTTAKKNDKGVSKDKPKLVTVKPAEMEESMVLLRSAKIAEKFSKVNGECTNDDKKRADSKIYSEVEVNHVDACLNKCF